MRIAPRNGRPYSIRSKVVLCLTLALAAASVCGPAQAGSAAPSPAPQGVENGKKATVQRKELFERVATVTGMPWYYLAAVDQYERTMRIAKKRPQPKGLIGIYIPEVEWAGLTNPDHEANDPKEIALFHGRGRDGDGDGLADRQNDMDLLFTTADHLLRYGAAPEDFREGLLEYYRSERAVERIAQFARLYAAFDTLDLHQHAFPLPLGSDYSYRSTWGASRGWGGYHIHEGTDLFARYGVPVRSTCYGIVEVMGWNPYGGWRVGIRDLDNLYHYFAHLSGFNKEVKAGDIVKPGQTIGWVGSSGYGKPGTSGKFPPHLHYGLYRDNGKTEWSFDPYPHLRKWEREERLRREQKK